jgi:hypothetical protein
MNSSRRQGNREQEVFINDLGLLYEEKGIVFVNDLGLL